MSCCFWPTTWATAISATIAACSPAAISSGSAGWSADQGGHHSNQSDPGIIITHGLARHYLRGSSCMRTTVFAAGALFLLVGLARPDEGMWLLNAPPRKLLKERHGFEPTASWLEHLQKSSVRFGSGGSASFVSPNGLVMTNHHVGRDSIQKLSTKDKDYQRDGFYAKSHADELRCPDLQLNVLQSIEDVTASVKKAVPTYTTPEKAAAARRAVMAKIEKESQDKTGLRSDVVTLYQGGLYHLYRYKTYTDVRLVFAPEGDIAHFGGDPDNFEYPRYCLDVAFFRVYEDGKPAKTEHFLKWSPKGASADELVFVSGHPGRTSRLNTVAHLELARDMQYPAFLNLMRRREVTLKTWGDRSAENARRASAELMRIQNSRKLLVGMVTGLQDPAVLEQKRSEEKGLRAQVSQKSELKSQYGDAWDRVEESVKDMRRLYQANQLLEGAGRGLGSPWAFNSTLFNIARTLVRYPEEKEKLNGERLREYQDTNIESLKQLLFSPAPIYDDLETVKLADSLGMLAEARGADEPLVKQVLDGKAPPTRASELISGTRLKDVTERERLFRAGKEGLNAAKDPLILLARLVDKPAREVRQQYEEKVEEPQKQAYGKISNAIFALRGQDQYPDATFTLRLAFGTVKGYEENGTHVGPFTTFGGCFSRAEEHGQRGPFRLPKYWLDKKGKLDVGVPFNFVCTADIIGGNSGSPVVNRQGEVVGLIFDGNIQSLVADFAYTQVQGRAVAVDSRGILAALRDVYGATALADEIIGSK